MKKIVVIFLLLQIATNNLFAEQLIKLPALFTHYYHHNNSQNHANGFFNYLQKHYLASANTEHEVQGHHDNDDDCELPFKQCDECCANTHLSSGGFMPSYDVDNKLYVPVSQKKFTTQNDQIKTITISNIWQPPKI